MKNRTLLLSIYSVILLIFAMLYSLLPTDIFSKIEYISFLNTFFIFAGRNIFNGLIPAVLAIGYSYMIYSCLKNDSRRRTIMVVNAIILIVLSLTLGILICSYSSWFHLQAIIKFTNNMTMIGLLIIVLSFVWDSTAN
jgi:hypothetical protein